MQLESINIEFAENGFTVSCHYKAEEKKGKDTMAVGGSYIEPKKHVFDTSEEVAKFVSKKLGKTQLNEEEPTKYRKRRDSGEGA
jgi:hypothetical protein